MRKRFFVRRSVYNTFFIWDGERERVCDGYYAIKQWAIDSCDQLNQAVQEGVDPWSGDAIYCHADMTQGAIDQSQKAGERS